jgi:enoyl-CoA hydratase/carnithine racemase
LCGVDGPALGGAVGLALSADLVWAGPGAEFAFPETKVGIVPALVSVVARRRIPPGKLAALALAGLAAGPAEALRLGLADFAPPDSAAAAAGAFARRLMRENSAEAMRRTKAFLQKQFAAGLEDQLADAKWEFSQAVATRAAARGREGFRARQPVRWDQVQE